MSFWELIWTIVVSFLFVAYLILLFQILTDLFRDTEMGGFAKAVWVFFLLVTPFISALVYVVARGNGMARRSQEHTARMAEETENYVRRVAGRPTPAEQIESAHTLLEQGEITETEYDRLKSMALA